MRHGYWRSMGAFERSRRLAARGAAFLLAVYLSALSLLLLGGISLQRTTMDVRAAQASHDLQQSFWLAEGGLDAAVTRLRTGDIAVDTSTSVACGTFAAGTASCQIQTLSDTFRSGVQELVYQISSSGRLTPTSTPAVLQMTVRIQRTFSGAVANKWVKTLMDPTRPITIQGSIRSAWGQVDTVEVVRGMTVTGDVVIGSPDAVGSGGYSRLFGSNPVTDGIVLAWGNEVIGQKLARPMGVLRPASPSDKCPPQAQPWIVLAGTYHVRDGDLLDLSPAGDGEVLICVPYVEIRAGADVTFEDPTVLYATAGKWTSSKDPKKIVAFDNNGEVHVAQRLQQYPDRGLTVVVTLPPNASTGGRVFTGQFEGSVYAPASYVRCGEDDASRLMDLRLGFVVADKLRMNGINVDFRPANDQVASPSLSPRSKVIPLSWLAN